MSRQVLFPNANWEVDVSSGGITYKMILSSTGQLQVPGNLSLLIGGYTGIVSHSNTANRTYSLLDRSGTLPLQDLTSLIAMAPSIIGNSGKVLGTDGTTLSWVDSSTGGITSLNGLTGATQTFAIGTTGTAPNVSSVTTVHTINIPMAATASVTAGLLSNTDYGNIGFINNSNTWAGTQTFTNAPKITNTSTDPTALVTYAQLQAAAAGFRARPDVAIIDTTDTTLPTINPVIDTRTIVLNDRVLFTNLLSGNNEIYQATVSLNPVTWVLQTDGQAGTGAPSVGDTVFVNYGSHAGYTYTYENGGSWVIYNVNQAYTFSTGLSVSGTTITVAYGTSSSTACVGNDSRLSDSRTPTAHVLDSASHTVSGETPGAILLATSATTFAFTAITGDLGITSAGATTVNNIGGVAVANLGLTITSSTLNDNTATPTLVPSCAFSTSTYRSVIIEFSISRGAGNYACGTLVMVYDGTNANLVQNFDIEIGTLGITFTGSIVGTNMQLMYVTTSTGTAATMKFNTVLFVQ